MGQDEEEGREGNVGPDESLGCLRALIYKTDAMVVNSSQDFPED